MKEIGMEGTEECDLVEWDSIINCNDREGGFELKDFAVIADVEELFFKILGLDFHPDDKDIEYSFPFATRGHYHRSARTVLEFSYDEDKVDEGTVSKLQKASTEFQRLFISAGLQSIYDDFENMSSDEYVIEEMVERELLFDSKGNPGQFRFTTLQDVKVGPYCHSVADCQKEWDATLTETEKP